MTFLANCMEPYKNRCNLAGESGPTADTHLVEGDEGHVTEDPGGLPKLSTRTMLVVLAVLSLVFLAIILLASVIR